jgi:predicted RNase H-like HicB family nuclease
LLVAGGATKAEALENIRATIREYLTAVGELLQDTPNTEVREVDIAM